jgi:hypothetical protein
MRIPGNDHLDNLGYRGIPALPRRRAGRLAGQRPVDLEPRVRRARGMLFLRGGNSVKLSSGGERGEGIPHSMRLFGGCSWSRQNSNGPGG